MSNGSLQSDSRWLLSLARGGQSVIIHFCVDKLSELQISLVGELSSSMTLTLMRVQGIHIQPLKPIPVMDAYKVVHPETVFKRRLYRTHLLCKNVIYFLTIF